MHALEEHKQLCKTESDYGSEAGLRRHPSLGSLASTASASVASTGSFKVIKKSKYLNGLMKFQHYLKLQANGCNIMKLKMVHDYYAALKIS